MPADEKEFIRAIQDARTASPASAKSRRHRAVRRAQRREAICRVLSTPTVSGWIGHISKLGSNSDGKGVLEISLADGLRSRPGTMIYTDIRDNTLIDPSSPLFHALSQMKVGDEVSFSGLLLLSDLDCVRESSSLLTSPACEATRTNPRSESLTETKYSAREEAGPAPPPFRWTAIEREEPVLPVPLFRGRPLRLACARAAAEHAVAEPFLARAAVGLLLRLRLSLLLRSRSGCGCGCAHAVAEPFWLAARAAASLLLRSRSGLLRAAAEPAVAEPFWLARCCG